MNIEPLSLHNSILEYARVKRAHMHIRNIFMMHV